MNTADELRKLALRAAEDPSILNGLSPEDITEMRRALNPAGGVVSTDICYANLSIVNYEDNARFNFLMMALIGFVYRLIKEYTPEPTHINKKYDPQIEKATGDLRRNLIKRRDEEINAFQLEQRKIITEFMDRNFEYNPDIHVRQAKTKGFEDEERVAIHEKIRNAMDAKKRQQAEESLKKPNSYTILKEIVGASYNNMVSGRAAIDGCIKALRDPANDIEDKIGILLKNRAVLNKTTTNLGKVHVPLAAAATVEAYHVNPPADVFHHFRRYVENHHEALLDLSLAYFNEKPDMEFMVTLYSVHHSEKEAEEYRKQHNDEFRAQVDTISSGGSTLLGPYKENRERIQYYTRHTELLRSMAEKNEQDARLGKDILEKAVQRKKAANIREAGPDSAGLKNYSSSVGMGTMVDGMQVGTHVSHEGAKKLIPHDKMKELEKKISAEKAATSDASSSAAAVEPAFDDSGSSAASAAASSASSAAAVEPALDDSVSSSSSSSSSSSAAASSAAASSAASTEGPAWLSERAIRYNTVNLEAHYKERAPRDELEAKIMSGTYTINDTDDSELPPDAVQTQIFMPVLDEDGEVKSLSHSYIYTAAEKPLHLERQSPYANAYQPQNKTGRPLPMKETVVLDHNGMPSKVHVIEDPTNK